MLIKNTVLLLSALLITSIVTIAFAEGKIGYAEELTFDESAQIRQAVKDECQLQTKLPIFLGKYLKETGYVSSNPSEGNYVDMKITQVHAIAGGRYSGPKWVEVKGTLHENGTAGPSFRAKRVTTKGARACQAAARCVKAIAKDISIWLKSPVDGAGLGDAKDAK